MIDKFESNDKLLELVYLNNFGIDLNIHKTLKSLISEINPENEKNFQNLLEKLELKKLLIIYEYLYIGSKKIDNLFYKLDLDQIDEDLYGDFCQRSKKEDEYLDKHCKIRRNRQVFLKAQFNMGYKILPEDKKINEVYKKKEDKKEEDKKENDEQKNKPKTNILINNEINEDKESNNNNINQGKKGKGKKKKGKGQFIEFDIHNYI